MPIYEYVCKDCSRGFEALVGGSIEPECPDCHGKHLEKQLSVFAVGKTASPPIGPCGAPCDDRGKGPCACS